MDEVKRLVGLWRRAGAELVRDLRKQRDRAKRLRQSEAGGGTGVGEPQLRKLARQESALTPRALATLCVHADITLAEGLGLLGKIIERLDLAGEPPTSGGPHWAPRPPDVFLIGEEPESSPTMAAAAGEPGQPWERGWDALREDLDCAQHCLDGDYFEAAVFHAHFAASAAVHQLAGQAGRAAQRMTDLLATVTPKPPEEVRSAAKGLDKQYLPLRYLSPLPPGLSPLSDREAAEDAIAAAERILAFCKNRLLQRERARPRTDQPRAGRARLVSGEPDLD